VTSAVPDELRDRLIEAAARWLAAPADPSLLSRSGVTWELSGGLVDAVLPLVRAELAAAEQRAEQAERDRDQAFALLRQVRDAARLSSMPFAEAAVRLIDSYRLLDPAQPTREEQAK
jgi:hypothetical protein